MSGRNSPRNTSKNTENDALNRKGGVLFKDEDLVTAFNFFDVKGNGKISGADLKERFEALTKKTSKKEIKIMLDGKESITLQEIRDLLKDNELTMDPYTEAFAILDPTGNAVSEERLKKIFSNLGYGDLSDEELQLLIRTGDADGDGKIGLSDFKLLGTSSLDQDE